jgi:hypothetical protein
MKKNSTKGLQVKAMALVYARAMRSSADAQSNDGAPDLVPTDVERVLLLVDDLMRWIHCPN